MKNKNIILAFAFVFVLAFAVSMASATVNVNFNAFSGEVKANGSAVYSTDPISNFSVVGYVCGDAQCSTVSSQFLAPTSSSGNSVRVTFPTKLQSQYGYGVYFYKEGYIGWEQPSTLSGNGNYPNNVSVYFGKKELCYSPITNLQVLNQIEPNKPLMVNVTTGIDADTHAAILNAGPLDYAPSEEANIKKINTSVNLNIKDQSGNVIYTEMKNVLIDYSGSQNVQFQYVFNKTGKYRIEVVTDVPDAKCLSSVPQTAAAQTQVINQNDTNYAYTLIQNISMDPVYPLVNENIKFSFNYLSNYANSTGDLIPINTSIYANITRNGNLIDQDYFLLGQEDTVNFNTFSFVKSVSTPGTYLLTVRGVPNSTIVRNKNLEMTQTMQFVVGGVPDSSLNSITIIRPINNEVFNVTSIPLQFIVNGTASSCYYSLDNSVNTTISSCQNTTIVAQNGSHMVKVYASNQSNIVSAGVNFSVSLPNQGQQNSSALTITIVSPANNAVLTSNSSIPLQYIITGNASACWYNLDNGMSINLPGCMNSSFSLPNGNHAVNVFANNSNGTVFGASSSFMVNVSTNSGCTSNCGGNNNGGGGGGITVSHPFNSTIPSVAPEEPIVHHVVQDEETNLTQSASPSHVNSGISWIWVLLIILILLIIVILILIFAFGKR